MTNTKTLEATHNALTRGLWNAARQGLDTMLNSCEPAAFNEYLGHPDAYIGAPQHIRDRISAYNSNVAKRTID
jgi:hypothetical protein